MATDHQPPTTGRYWRKELAEKEKLRAEKIEMGDRLLAAQEQEENRRDLQRIQEQAHRQLQAEMEASQATVKQLRNRVFELECDLKNGVDSDGVVTHAAGGSGGGAAGGVSPPQDGVGGLGFRVA